jgi:hypothetical protein
MGFRSRASSDYLSTPEETQDRRDRYAIVALTAATIRGLSWNFAAH